jgi:hypothetical protein
MKSAAASTSVSLLRSLALIADVLLAQATKVAAPLTVDWTTRYLLQIAEVAVRKRLGCDSRCCVAAPVVAASSRRWTCECVTRSFASVEELCHVHTSARHATLPLHAQYCQPSCWKRRVEVREVG